MIARATARVARTIPSCPCYTSPCIVRATLAVALGLGQGAACIVRAILAVALAVILAIIHRPGCPPPTDQLSANVVQ